MRKQKEMGLLLPLLWLFFLLCSPSLDNPADPQAPSYTGEEARAIAGSDTVVSINDTVVLWGRCTLDSAVVDSFFWDVDGDGEVDFASTESGSLRYAFSDSGYYRGLFEYIDKAGTRSSDTVGVMVKQDVPVIFGPDTVYAGINDPVVLKMYAQDTLGTLVKYEWDFDNDGVYDTSFSKSTDIIKTFTTAVTHYCRLKVTDDDSNTVTHVYKVVVQTSLPILEGPGDVYAGVNDVFVLRCLASDSDGVIQTYEWDLDGDGAFDTSTTCDSIFTAMPDTGMYVVWVRTTDDDSNKTVGRINVHVLLNPPQLVSVRPDTTVSIYDTVSLCAEGYDSNGTVVAYEWDLDNDGVYDTIVPDTAWFVAGSDSGRQEISVRCVDNDNVRSAKLSFTLQIVLDPPVVKAGHDTTFHTGETVTLKGNGADEYGQIVRYEWSIGGTEFGQTGTGDTTFVVPQPTKDTFVCVLRVTDNDGNLSSDTLKMAVIQYYEGMRCITAKGKTFEMGKDTVYYAGDLLYPNQIPKHSVTLSYNFLMDTSNVADSINWFEAALLCNERSKEEGLDTVYTYNQIWKFDYIVFHLGDDPYPDTLRDRIALGNIAANYTAKGYRLPSEAEWEYAAKVSNFGYPLWCSDNYDQYTSDPKIDPICNTEDSLRVLRSANCPTHRYEDYKYRDGLSAKDVCRWIRKTQGTYCSEFFAVRCIRPATIPSSW